MKYDHIHPVPPSSNSYILPTRLSSKFYCRCCYCYLVIPQSVLPVPAWVFGKGIRPISGLFPLNIILQKTVNCY